MFGVFTIGLIVISVLASLFSAITWTVHLVRSMELPPDRKNNNPSLPAF